MVSPEFPNTAAPGYASYLGDPEQFVRQGRIGVWQ